MIFSRLCLPVSKNLPRTKGKINGPIHLVEEISNSVTLSMSHGAYWQLLHKSTKKKRECGKKRYKLYSLERKEILGILKKSQRLLRGRNC